MDTHVRMPFMERRLDNLHIQKGPMPGGATAFPARSFVKLVGGLLVPCATGNVVCFGQAPGPSHAATDLPPVSLYGNMHWVFNPRHAQFIVNITDGSGNIGQAAGAPQLSSVVVGTAYGLYTNGSGLQMLNIADTTNKFFRVVAIYPGQALADYNGLVLVEVVAEELLAGATGATGPTGPTGP